MTVPFQYPATPHIRRHGPKGYADYASFRPWLRDEYTFRCVYCLRREQWIRSQGAYDIDHFFPATQHPAQECEYDNLRYSCSICNALKSDKLVPDPLEVFVESLVWVSHDGTLHADSADAKKLIEELGLNSEDMIEYRNTWIEVVAMAEIYNSRLHRQLMGFPKDLPELKRLRPPGGNTRPKGIPQSFFEQRKRDELPETY